MTGLTPPGHYTSRLVPSGAVPMFARLASLALRALPIGALIVACATAVAAPPPALTVPPLDYRQRVLPNGLTVITLEDHASPTVSVQVWYGVGGKDDPPGRSGFAHLFEHMMFKRTKHLAAEQFDRMTEDVGGLNNAGTTDDFTEYHEVIPSNHLQRLLWAEAERMANLDVAEDTLKSERAVVQEEYRQRVLADPYGRFHEALAARSYAVHPYRRGTIGDIAQLDAATLDDVRAFHRTYYRPDNAVLIVTGDFDPKELDGWIDKYFGALPKPDTPIPRVTAVEPPRTQSARYRETGPNVPLPAVALTWLAPSARSKDAPALQVVAALLGRGESSRMNQALVYRGQIAQTASFGADLRVDTGLLVAYAIAASGSTPDQLAKALRAEIARLADQPVPAAELAKIKTQLVTQALVERQTPLGKGEALGDAAVTQGDVRRVNKELADLQAVTAADVQRVVRQYLIDAPEVTIDYVQEGKS
jgi:zinc protease